MPTGIHVNRNASPTGMTPSGRVPDVEHVSEQELRRLEDQMRAHVRERMERKGWGPTELAKETGGGVSQGYISKWLLGGRGSGTDPSRGGISVRKLVQLVRPLGLDLFVVLGRADVPAQFWKDYVPQKSRPARALGATAHPPRRTRAGGAH